MRLLSNRSLPRTALRRHGRACADAAPPAETSPWNRRTGEAAFAYVERPLTLPEMALSPQLDAAIARAELGRVSATAVQMELAASFGITDDLMVEARPLGFITGDVDTDYTRFQLGATYRFLDGPVEIGGRFRFQIDSNANLALNPGIAVRIHAGNVARIDTGLNFTGVVPTGSGDPVAGLGGIVTDFLKPAEAGIPLDVSFQVVDPVFVGLSTGFAILTLEEAGDTSFMPLGFFAGGTVPGDDGPLADIGASFGFPLFIIAAATKIRTPSCGRSG